MNFERETANQVSLASSGDETSGYKRGYIAQCRIGAGLRLTGLIFHNLPAYGLHLIQVMMLLR